MHGIQTLFVILLIGACTPSSDSAPSFEVYDSAGISIALSTDSSWTPRTRWTIDPAPSVVIGTRDGDPQQAFGRIGDVVILADNRLAISDVQSNEIRIFDADGGFLLSLGASGAGPAEFSRLDRIAAIRGDSLVARDVGAFKSIIFSTTDGGSRTTLGPSILWNDLTAVYVAGWLDDGSAVVSHTPQRSEYPPGRGVVTAEWYILDSAVRVLMSAGRLPAVETNNTGDGAAPLAFSGRARIATDSDGFWFAFPKRIDLVHYGLTGVDRIIRTNFVPPQVPANVRESYKAWFADNSRSYLGNAPAELRALVEARIDQLAFADRLPAYKRILVSGDGSIWLENHETVAQLSNPSWSWDAGGKTERWTVFSPRGEWLGSIEAPDGATIRAVTDDRIAAIVSDELDVQYVVIHRILRPSSGS